MKPLKFKSYFLLSEAIKKTDIIDLYILMAMPRPSDPASQFIADEVANKAVWNVKNEIENILIREMRHTEEIIEWPDYVQLNRIIKMDKKQLDLTQRAAETGYDYFDDDSEFSGVNEDAVIVVNILNEFNRALFGGAVPLKKLAKGLYNTEKFLSRSYGDEGDNKYNTAEVTLSDLIEKTKLPWTIDSLIGMFNVIEWSGGYGGEKWGVIAQEAKNLLSADKNEIFKKLDRFVDFVHNSGAVINKFKGYQEGWIKFILDLKAFATNIRELIPYASRDIQKLFRDQDWRMTMSKMPGLGAQETTQAADSMMLHYFKAAVKDAETDGWIRGDLSSKISALGNEFGTNGFIKYIIDLASREPAFKKLARATFDNLEYYDAEDLFPHSNSQAYTNTKHNKLVNQLNKM